MEKSSQNLPGIEPGWRLVTLNGEALSDLAPAKMGMFDPSDW
jgi:hypothetical protein